MVDAYHTKFCPPAASPASVAILDQLRQWHTEINFYILFNFPIHEAVQIIYFISLYNHKTEPQKKNIHSFLGLTLTNFN